MLRPRPSKSQRDSFGPASLPGGAGDRSFRRNVTRRPTRLRGLVDPVTLHANIDRPREEVFAYLADVANHPEFTDHFLKDWHLTREQSEGRGAGARYRQDGRFDRFGYYDVSLAELDPPRRIVAVGRGGKYNRIRTFHEWVLEPSAG